MRFGDFQSFSAVYNPYDAGIAQAACVKPYHIVGLETITPFEDALQVLMKQIPDLSHIGSLFDTGSASGIYGMEQISAFADAMSLTVTASGVTSAADVSAAAEALVSKGVEAIVLPYDFVTANALPIITQIANESGIPVFHPSVGAVRSGATITAGFHQYRERGSHTATILLGLLKGEIDPAATGIGISTSLGVGLNMDSAAEQGVDIADELVEMADMMISDGQFQMSESYMTDMLISMGLPDNLVPLLLASLEDSLSADAFGPLPPDALAFISQLLMSEDLLARDAAFLESLQCTDEMIAEQQAALDAAGG